MIIKGSRLLVGDNSGAFEVLCIGFSKPVSSIGDIITVVVKKASPTAKAKKASVLRAVIIRIRSPFRRKDGTEIAFGTNAVALLDKKDEMIGTRIFGPVPRELREKGFLKIISLAEEVR